MANVTRRREAVLPATDGAATGRVSAAPTRTSSVQAREATFDVGDGFTLPDLTGLPAVTEVGTGTEHDLDATYFDTVDLRLLRAGVTLRRRTGGSDAGWHLKADGSQVRLPPGRATRTVPAALAERVAVHARGGQLMPVARLRTRRTERPVLGVDGTVLARLAEDHVSASAPSPDGSRTSVTAWSELEVELVGGKRKLLRALTPRLLQAGATPGRAAPKLARALSDQLATLDAVAGTSHHGSDPVAELDGSRRDRGRGDGAASDGAAGGRDGRPAAARVRAGSAGAVVLDHLAEQVERLKVNDPLVRTDQPDAVHQMRVATRRLRSALSTFRPLLERTVTDPVRDELRWLAGVLGAARDAEVIRDHLRGVVEAEPGDLVLGPVQARVVTALGTRYRSAHDTLVTTLDGGRYFALLDVLDRLVVRPPFTDLAAGTADDVLLPLVAKTWKRMRRARRRAESSESPRTGPDLRMRGTALHELRKAAKRARYAGEAVAPRYGAPAKRWAAAMEALQETLGAHQDTVVIRQTLRELAVVAYLDGENAFTYGRLHALEQARAEATALAYQPEWEHAARRRLHRWLKG